MVATDSMIALAILADFGFSAVRQVPTAGCKVQVRPVRHIGRQAAGLLAWPAC